MSEQTVTLVANDNAEFTVDIEKAMLSTVIKDIIGDSSEKTANTKVPLENINGYNLALIVQYMNNPKEWEYTETEYLKLKDFIEAANYLNVEPLYKFMCKYMGDIIMKVYNDFKAQGLEKGKVVDETVLKMRALWNLPNEYTPEEEAEVKKENEWLE